MEEEEPPPLVIERAKPSDKEALLSLLEEFAREMKTLGKGKTKGLRKRWKISLMLRIKSGKVLVARENGNLVGLVIFSSRSERDAGYEGEDYIYLDTIFVRKDARGRGVGRALMEKLIEFAKKQKVAIELDVDVWNKSALAFYQRLGFKKVGYYMRLEA